MSEFGKFNSGLLQTGMIIAYQSRDNSWFSKQIVQTQLDMGYSVYESAFTHTEPILNDGQTLDAAFPKLNIVDPVKQHKGRYAVILEFISEDYCLGRFDVALNSLKLSYDHRGYDWFGVLKFKTKWMFHKVNEYFCSEISLASIEKRYPGSFANIYKIPPAGVVASKKFRLKWAGIIE